VFLQKSNLPRFVSDLKNWPLVAHQIRVMSGYGMADSKGRADMRHDAPKMRHSTVAVASGFSDGCSFDGRAFV
jgi:hypothetical protein